MCRLSEGSEVKVPIWGEKKGINPIAFATMAARPADNDAIVGCGLLSVSWSCA